MRRKWRDKITGLESCVSYVKNFKLDVAERQIRVLEDEVCDLRGKLGSLISFLALVQTRSTAWQTHKRHRAATRGRNAD